MSSGSNPRQQSRPEQYLRVGIAEMMVALLRRAIIVLRIAAGRRPRDGTAPYRAEFMG
ncbi:MAG: hypothetical protein O7D34_08455 [Ignavibacteria bacterium]|nr:hypothetical protein [Ignavibacteria bacterium]